MERIAITTGGGDAPGLNAVIRAATKTAINDYGCKVFGIRDGLDGLLSEDGVYELTMQHVRGILPRGGTILGAANRGNPFARKIERDGQVMIEDISDEIVARMHSFHFDAVLFVGGDGTLHIAHKLCQRGVPGIGVPKTIDNDIGFTDYTFGFDTAVNTAMEAIDRLHTTAESHHRVMVLELMGRDAGFIAMHAGLAGGADVILIPEIPFDREAVCRKIVGRKEGGASFSIVVVAEGAHARGGEQVYAIPGDAVYVPRLGGVGMEVADFIGRHCGVETRLTVLGHLQRGGSPSAFDRVLCTRLGAAAVRLAARGGFGRMVALRGGNIEDASFEEALAVPKRIDINGDLVQTARGLGISLGEL